MNGLKRKKLLTLLLSLSSCFSIRKTRGAFTLPFLDVVILLVTVNLSYRIAPEHYI